jgi:hypothetical protein
MSLLDRHAAVILSGNSATNQHSNSENQITQQQRNQSTAKPINADQADEPNQSNAAWHAGVGVLRQKHH